MNTPSVGTRVAEFDLIARIRARAASRGDVVLGIGDDAALDLGAHIGASSDRLQANRDEIDFLHGDFCFDGVWPWFTVLPGNGHGDGGGLAGGGVGVEFAQAEVIAGGVEGLGPAFGDCLLIQAGYFGDDFHRTRLLGEGGLVTDVQALVKQMNTALGEARQSLKKVDAVLVEAQGIASNTREATVDLGALRTEVEASLRKVETLVNEVNRKWPFARDTEIKLP